MVKVSKLIKLIKLFCPAAPVPQPETKRDIRSDQ